MSKKIVMLLAFLGIVSLCAVPVLTTSKTSSSTQIQGMQHLAYATTQKANCVGGVCIATKVFKPNSISKKQCLAEKAKNYGIKDCPYQTDYWAGAMKTCKDQGLRLPTDEELANLANALYKGMNATTQNKATFSGIDANGKNYKIGSNMPVPSTLSGIGTSWKQLWSNSENTDSRRGNYRFFYPTYSYKSESNRGSFSIRAICVAD